MSKDNLYLLYGEEQYLIKKFVDRLKESIISKEMEIMNCDVFDGVHITSEQIINAVNTLPFMNDKRLVIIKNSGLFVQGRKDESERTADFLKSLHETSVVLFIEKNIDKRSKIYKSVNKYGIVLEMKKPSDQDLIKFVIESCKDHKMIIASKTASHLITSVSGSMENILLEIGKLVSYKGEDTEITTEDIDNVCTKALDVRVFELVRAIGLKNVTLATSIYSNLILMKESPIMILAIMIRQFRFILLTKYMSRKRQGNDKIAHTLGLSGFVVNEYVRQSQNFTEVSLLKALEDCLTADINIKTGATDPNIAVELIILKYS